MWILYLDLKLKDPADFSVDSSLQKGDFQAEKRRIAGVYPPLPQEVSKRSFARYNNPMVCRKAKHGQMTKVLRYLDFHKQVPERDRAQIGVMNFILRKYPPLLSANESFRRCETTTTYFLGSTNTRAETAELLSVPPNTKGPTGVNTIPRVSARTSKVSLVIVSQRLPFTS